MAVQYEHIIMKDNGLNMAEEQQKESQWNQNILFYSMLMATIRAKHITKKE